ncbi:MAG: hypothetical protein AAF558_03930 [Verrucomicrobiota bacterium]
MRLRSFLLASTILAVSSVSSADIEVSVDPKQAVRSGSDRFVGINLNYIRDHDANRPPGSKELKLALKEMNAPWLRYPGGAKSDYHFWSKPPHKSTEPTSFGWYTTPEGRRLNFDEYVQLTRELDAIPYIVVAYDSGKDHEITQQQYLDHAVAWVTYSNITKGYGIKHWEIGNELWQDKVIDPREIADTVRKFSRAMKKVDPTIHVGASGNNQKWWDRFLPTAAPDLDFISMSLYNCWGWGSYESYLNKDNLIKSTETALSSIEELPIEHRDRIYLVVAEINSKDYSKDAWADDNSLGHAIVTFESLCQLAQKSSVEAAMLWTTRWMSDDEADDSLWYALGPQNELKASGMAVSLFGNFMKEQIVLHSNKTRDIRIYASKSRGDAEIALFVINKRTQPVRNLKIQIDHTFDYQMDSTYVFAGKNADDTRPTLEPLDPVTIQSNRIETISLPGPSVTVFNLSKVTSE